MANATYCYRAPACVQAINKTMFTLNNLASANVVRIYRIWMTSSSTASVTGGFGTYVLERIGGSAPAGGTTTAAIKHNTASAAVPSGITCLNGNVAITLTGVNSLGVLKTWTRSNDEPTSASLTVDELQTLPALNYIWDSGYGDTTIEPIVLRTAGEGIRIYSLNAGVFGASTVDIVVECTITAT